MQVVCKFMMDYLGFDSMQSAKTLRDEYFQQHGINLGFLWLSACHESIEVLPRRYHSTMKGLNMATKDSQLALAVAVDAGTGCSGASAAGWKIA